MREKSRRSERETSRGALHRAPLVHHGMHRLVVSVLVGLLLGIVPGAMVAVHAQEIPDTIVVTAEAPEAPADPGITVIDVAEARRRGHETVADVVAATPAISIQRRGSGFEPATLRVRGSTAEQVLILRDGRPLNDAAGTIVDLSRISLHDVERIEIIRGAATAITGHGGAAGAINLITPGRDGTGSTLDTDNPTGSSRISLGSFREVRLDGSVDVRPAGTVDLSVAAAGVLSDNRYDYERAGGAETRVNGGGREGSLAVTVGTHPGGRRDSPDSGQSAVRPRVESSLRVSSSNRGLPGSVEFPSATARLTDSSLAATTTFTSGRRGDTGWGIDVGAQGTLRSRAFTDPGYPLGAIDTTARLSRLASDTRLRWNPTGTVRLESETGVQAEWLNDDDLGDRRRVHGWVAPMVAITVPVRTASELRGTLHGRGEVVRDSGTVTETTVLPSVRATTAWSRYGRHGIESTVEVAVGTAYRLPAFAELFWPAGAFAVGNPDLRAESSRSMELATTFEVPRGLRLELRGHGAWYEDLIQWLPDPRGIWQPRNTGEARMVGVEAIAGLEGPLGLSPWSAGITVSGEFLLAQDRTPGPTYNLQLPYRPETSAQGELSLSHLAGHALRASAQAVGERPITAANTRRLDPYVRLDLNGEIALPGTPMSVGAGVNNLLDTPFVETRFYPNPGREFVLFAEASW
jgi:vitamin B12 transporter